MALPGVSESADRFAFSVDRDGKARGFVWIWMERVVPKKPRVPNAAVIAARVANGNDKAALLAADPDTFFTEPHYNGFPAVLVRLAQVTQAVLRQVITEAWRCQSPRPLVAAYDAAAPIREPSKPARQKPSAARRAAPTATAPRTPKRAAPATGASRGGPARSSHTASARPARRASGSPPARSGSPAKRRAGGTG